MNSTDGTQSYRYERKFVVPVHMEQCLSTILRSSSLGFREIYAERLVNNVYFDTPMFRFYNENVQGIADRKKVRIRWYGETLKPATCRFEVKRKAGVVGTKDVYSVTVHTGSATPYSVASMPLPAELQSEFMEVRPVLFNRYKRRYFLSADSRFRITMDYQLQYSHPSVLQYTGNMGTPDVQAVLELKYDRGLDLEAASVAAEIPFPFSRKSKYVTGVSAVYSY